MIRCACCNDELRAVFESSIEIDVCDNCSSAWLDQGELNHIVSRAPPESRMNLDTASILASAHVTDDLTCPHCGTSHFVDLTVDHLQVSRCEDCGGMHVDHHSLDRLSGLQSAKNGTDGEAITRSETEENSNGALEEGSAVLAQGAFEFVAEGLIELVFHLLVSI